MVQQISNQDYPIYLGSIFDKLNEYILQMEPVVSKIFILVDENTHMHCISPLVRHVSILEKAEILEIDVGESEKNLNIANHLWEALSINNVDRQALIINLGGGVVSDLGGFIASVYKRGIRFINIPTSLLAMVDASVGGKTGIDLAGVKNQLGCFANPQAVFVWPRFLETLPFEEIQSGFGEVIKYSLLDSTGLWEEVMENDFFPVDQAELYISRCLRMKCDVVAKDPKEYGPRRILNLGHTYGHAFESLSLLSDNEDNMTHGKAVALGIIGDLWHSVQKLQLSELVFEEVKNYILKVFGYYSVLPQNMDAFIDLMKKDKKNSGDQIAVILIDGIGNPRYNEFITESEVRQFLQYFNSL